MGEPNLSDTTWAPQPDSRFRFYVDGRLRATVADRGSAYLTGLPTARPIRVRVLLDGRPFEAFSLDLAEALDHRVCLWLYPGYWHWIDNGWDAKLGCRCGEAPAAVRVQEGGAMEDDLKDLSREELTAEVERLRAGIRQHRDSTGHALCWYHPALWNLLPEKADAEIAVPDWAPFLRGCVKYRESLDAQAPEAPRIEEEFGG